MLYSQSQIVLLIINMLGHQLSRHKVKLQVVRSLSVILSLPDARSPANKKDAEAWDHVIQLSKWWTSGGNLREGPAVDEILLPVDADGDLVVRGPGVVHGTLHDVQRARDNGGRLRCVGAHRAQQQLQPHHTAFRHKILESLE